MANNKQLPPTPQHSTRTRRLEEPSASRATELAATTHGPYWRHNAKSHSTCAQTHCTHCPTPGLLYTAHGAPQKRPARAASAACSGAVARAPATQGELNVCNVCCPNSNPARLPKLWPLTEQGLTAQADAAQPKPASAAPSACKHHSSATACLTEMQP